MDYKQTGYEIGGRDLRGSRQGLMTGYL